MLTRLSEPWQAAITASYLRSRSIHAFPMDMDLAQMNWLMISAFGGVRVLVMKDDLAAAQAALAEVPKADISGPVPPLWTEIVAGGVTVILSDFADVLLPILRQWPRLFGKKR